MPPRATKQSQSQASQKSYAARGKRPAVSDDEHDDDDQMEDDEEEDRKPRRSTQKQSQSQSQRRRRDPSPDADEDDDESGGGDGDGDSGMTLDAKASALVRLAFATEYRRGALRREEVVKKVLKGEGKHFKDVFNRAQVILRKNFGYELFELQTRQERERVLSGKEKDEESQKKSASSKQYVLRSTLPPELIAAASQVDRELRDLEVAERNEDETLGVPHDDGEALPEGSILAHTDRDALGARSLGLLHVVLALIVVNGRTINEQHLRNWLKKLRMGDKSLVVFPSNATRQTITLNEWFAEMVRLNYLDRIVSHPGAVGGASGAGKRQRRVRVNADEDSGEIVEVRWGERAHAEISEKGVAEWVVEFMLSNEPQGEADDDDDEPTNAREQKARNQRHAEERAKRDKAMETMMKDVRRAAGGLEG